MPPVTRPSAVRPSRAGPRRAAVDPRSSVVALAFAALALAAPAACRAAVPLAPYNVGFGDVSVSGLSSGAYMAAQLHVAYSGTIRKGAGIVAGGPVYCSQGNLAVATGPCMADTGPRNLPYLLSVVSGWSANGAIDPVSNLATSKVYLFSGTLDSSVRQPVMNDLKTMYLAYLPSTSVVYKNDLAAEHAMPTDSYGNACSYSGPPYIDNCGYDTAGEILKTLYGTLNPRNAGTLGGSFVNFDQKVFWGNLDPTNHGMANDGWAYVPAACASRQPCRLHVVLHGCKQYAATLGSQYYQKTGYNAWADSNRIVVLYPQAATTYANPNGCWDWWGYDDVNFPLKSGGQMVAIKTMIDRVTSGSAAAPYTCAHWYDSNLSHVAYGRAYAVAGSAYAVGSNQYLGWYSAWAYTDVRRTSAGYHAYGRCS